MHKTTSQRQNGIKETKKTQNHIQEKQNACKETHNVTDAHNDHKNNRVKSKVCLLR